MFVDRLYRWSLGAAVLFGGISYLFYRTEESTQTAEFGQAFGVFAISVVLVVTAALISARLPTPVGAGAAARQTRRPSTQSRWRQGPGSRPPSRRSGHPAGPSRSWFRSRPTQVTLQWRPGPRLVRR